MIDKFAKDLVDSVGKITDKTIDLLLLYAGLYQKCEFCGRIYPKGNGYHKNICWACYMRGIRLKKKFAKTNKRFKNISVRELLKTRKLYLWID